MDSKDEAERAAPVADAGSQFQNGPLEELAHLANGLQAGPPGPYDDEPLDEYEEVSV
jgi:hypothetical protein